MTVKIKHYDRLIKRLTETEYSETQAMIKVYGVGQLTALTYVLTLGSKRTVPAKSRRRLLPWPEAKAQPVWGSRPAARHHQGWQRLPTISAV
jgi:hypothetical protein